MYLLFVCFLIQHTILELKSKTDIETSTYFVFIKLPASQFLLFFLLLPRSAQTQAQLEAESALFSFDPAPQTPQ